MTKKEYRKSVADWNRALEDGRVIRIDELNMKSFPTISMRDAELAKLQACGVNARIVRVPC